MVLQWYGYTAFKVTGSQIDASVIIDPPDSSTGVKPSRLSADIIAITHALTDPSTVKAATAAPFMIEYPGEYEVKGVFATAIRAVKKNATDANILLSIGVDDVVIGHLGTIDRALSEQELDALGRIDVLLLPVGGGEALSPSLAVEVLKAIEPRVVIPMQYSIPGFKLDAVPVEQFLKEYGLKDVERLDKIKLMKRDLPSDETRVIVLNAS